eukprot:682479_1
MGTSNSQQITSSAVPNIPVFSSTTELNKYVGNMIGTCTYPIPGVSIAVITRSNTYFFNYGVQDLETQKKMTKKSVFHLYSGTKLFTATAVMQLWANTRSKLNIKDSITAFLPNHYCYKYFGIKDLATRHNLQDITIRHLLTHSSGFQDKMSGFMSIHLPHATNREQFTSLYALLRYGQMKVPSNQTVTSYCNFGYSLLGEIIHNANPYQLLYKDYMKRFIFAPLNMNVSFTYNDFAADDDIATGYIHKWSIMKALLMFLCGRSMYKELLGDKVGNIQALNPFELDSSSIGGIIGSVEQFAKFVEFQMNGNDEVLDSKYLKEMQKEQQLGIVGIESKYGVGYGWKIGKTLDDRMFINHEGGGPGFHSEMRIYPEYDCGIVICCNYSSVHPKGLAHLTHQISEVIFGSMDVITRDLCAQND